MSQGQWTMRSLINRKFVQRDFKVSLLTPKRLAAVLGLGQVTDPAASLPPLADPSRPLRGIHSCSARFPLSDVTWSLY